MPTLNELAACWFILNELLGDLRKRGVFIPDLTYADFRNSKMAIEYLRAYDEDIRLTDNAELTLREELEEQIYRLRETLMIWAEESGGFEYRETWEEKFSLAVRGEVPLPEEEPKTPITDLPREKDVSFFRIRLPEDIPVEIISEIAEDCRVIISLDGDRHLQVSGKPECVQDARQQLGELFYGEDKIKSK